MFDEAGGAGKPGVAQLPVCWERDEKAAKQLARDQFRWAAGGWKVQADLPGPASFDAYSQFVREEDMTDLVPAGPDPEPMVAGVRKFVEAGFERVALVQVGPDQEGFCEFYVDELRVRLAAL